MNITIEQKYPDRKPEVVYDASVTQNSHFWYSQTLAEQHPKEGRRLFFAMINGEKVQYTEANSERKECLCSLPDQVYLGTGEKYSYIPETEECANMMNMFRYSI